MSDYNEPWTTGHDGHGAMSIDDNHGNQICYVRNIEKSRRIVACVNACAGIETATLEGHALGVVAADHAMAVNQRNKLMAAAKNLRDVKGRHNSEIAMKRLIEAINEIEAEQ